MHLVTTGMAHVAIRIVMLLVMDTLSASSPDGRQMELTMLMSDGCTRMDFAITEVTANRMYACARAWATHLV